MGNGPSRLKAGAANLTGRRWGLKPGRFAKLSLPQVCESLRTREGRNPGTDAQAKRSAPLCEIFREIEAEFIETSVDIGTMSRAQAETAVTQHRPAVEESLQQQLDEWREELRAKCDGVRL